MCLNKNQNFTVYDIDLPTHSINALKNSAQLGKSEWGVIESDESDGSFVKVPSTYSIITNIDEEHLDYYKILE